MWFFAVTSPIVSIFLVVVYLTPWFSHSWTSRRILLIETSLDFMMFIGWMGGFIGSVVLVNGRCIAPPAATCTQYNWLISWLFFSAIAFFYALGIDFWSLYKGIYAPADIEHEILLDVRRTTRMNNR